MDDWYTVLFDPEGSILAVLSFESYNILPSAIQADDILLLITGIGLLGKLSVRLAASGIKVLFRTRVAAKIASHLSPGQARALVSALRKEGREVVVNVGGEAAKHEIKAWSHAINVNNVTPGRPADIPNLVKVGGEEMDSVFLPNSIDKVVASKIPTSVDPQRLAQATVRVLKKGGRIEINIFGSGVDTWSKKFIDALVKNGVPSLSIKNIGEVLITATK